MENNKNIKYATSAILTILALIIILTFGFGYKTIFLDQTKAPEPEVDKSVVIKEDKYQNVTNPRSYGTPISTTEEGFGRKNPFEPY